MIYRETESPLFHRQQLWDSQQDLFLAQGYLDELVDVLADTELLLGSASAHTGGNLIAFEESVGGVKLEGFLLQTPPIFNQNVSLTRALPRSGDAIYALTAWEYAAGAKAVLGDDRVVVAPHVEEKYVLTDRRPAQEVEYAATLSFNNAGASNNRTTLSSPEQALVDSAELDLDQFSIYSLYKINKLLNVIRADSHLA